MNWPGVWTIVSVGPSTMSFSPEKTQAEFAWSSACVGPPAGGIASVGSVLGVPGGPFTSPARAALALAPTTSAAVQAATAINDFLRIYLPPCKSAPGLAPLFNLKAVDKLRQAPLFGRQAMDHGGRGRVRRPVSALPLLMSAPQILGHSREAAGGREATERPCGDRPASSRPWSTRPGKPNALEAVTPAPPGFSQESPRNARRSVSPESGK